MTALRTLEDASTVDRWRLLPPQMRARVLGRLQPGALATVRYKSEGWARPSQSAVFNAPRNSSILAARGGRRVGKSWLMLRYFERLVMSGRYRFPRIIAATDPNLAADCINGAQGILKWCAPWLPERERWTFRKSDGFAGTLIAPNGVEVLCCSAKSPGQAIGIGTDLDYYSDVAGWVESCGPARAEQAWRQARTSNSEGSHPLALVATTRKGFGIVKRLLGNEIAGTHIIDLGSTHANRMNLAVSYRTNTLGELAGTDFYLEEIEDQEVAMSSPFAGLEFDQEPIRVNEVKDIVEIAIGVDPSGGKGARHDDWGIVAVGKRSDRHVVVLEDVTGDYDDGEAGTAALDLADRWGGRFPSATLVLAVESNKGPRAATAMQNGYLRRELKRLEGNAQAPRRPMPDLVDIRRDKEKPVVARQVRPLYGSGILHHGPDPSLKKLEEQQRTWDPDAPSRPKQDDRIDGMLTGVHYLADLPKAEQSEGRARFEAEAQCALAARMNEALSARRHPMPPLATGEPLPPQPVEGALPGDARYAGPKPRAIGARPNWRTRNVF